MEDNVKLGNFDYTIYQLEEKLNTALAYVVLEKKEWKTNSSDAQHRTRLNSYKEVLYWLTGDEKWNLSLEELHALTDKEKGTIK